MLQWTQSIGKYPVVSGWERWGFFRWGSFHRTLSTSQETVHFSRLYNSQNTVHSSRQYPNLRRKSVECWEYCLFGCVLLCPAQWPQCIMFVVKDWPSVVPSNSRHCPVSCVQRTIGAITHEPALGFTNWIFLLGHWGDPV